MRNYEVIMKSGGKAGLTLTLPALNTGFVASSTTDFCL